MARTLIGTRKAGAKSDAPLTTAKKAEGHAPNGNLGKLSDGHKGTGDGPAKEPKGKGMPSDGDTATCPNCGCEFDDETGDVVKPGAPVAGKNEGADLDAYMSAPMPVGPSHYGTAYDAANGSKGLAASVASVLRGGK